MLKGKQSIRSSVLGNQNSESELLLEDDDTLSSLEEKDLENLAGKELQPSATHRDKLDTLHAPVTRSALAAPRSGVLRRALASQR